jgi:SpoVK/Ycf46/Vps4 family AAA+-type ATPase
MWLTAFGLILGYIVRLMKMEYRIENVVGLDEVKDVLSERLDDYYDSQELYRKCGSIPDKGILIAGVPGCGKSMITKAIENDYSGNKNVEIIKIPHGKFMRGSVGSAAREMHNFFDKIRKKGKDVVLLIDEIDVLFPRRGSSGILANERTSAFLSEFDGLFDGEGANIFIVGTTNRPFDIDPALLRSGRLGRLCVINVPNKEERKKLFNLYMKEHILGFGNGLKVIKVRKVVTKNTVGYVGADFRDINLALTKIIKGKEKNGEPLILSQEEIIEAVTTIRRIRDKIIVDIEKFRLVYGRMCGG